MRYVCSFVLGFAVAASFIGCTKSGNQTTSFSNLSLRDYNSTVKTEPIGKTASPKADNVTNISSVPNPVNRLAPISNVRFPVLFRQEFTGTLHFWNVSYVNSQPLIDGAFTLPKIALSNTERVVGMADTNGDGLPEILVQDMAQNANGLSNLTVWVPQDASGSRWESSPVDAVPVGEQAVAFGDLNGTGGTEIAFHSHSKATLGQFYARILQGNSLRPTKFINSQLPVLWRAAGNGNINGVPIQVFQHRKTGQIQVWPMNADFTHGAVNLAQTADPNHWDLIGPSLMENYPGVVLLFRDLTNGDLLAWDMDVNLAQRATAKVAPGVSWDYVAESGSVDYKNFSHQFPMPNVFVPAGDVYLDNVPKTFDLADRANLAIHAIVNTFDKEDDYNLRWQTHLMGKTAGIAAGEYGGMNMKAAEALGLLRRMTGSRVGLDVDTNLIKNTIAGMTRDGILYMPIREPAAGRFNSDYMDADTANIFVMLPQARALSVFASYYRLMGEHPVPPSWAGDRLLQGLYRISTRHPASSGQRGWFEFWFNDSQRSTPNRYTLMQPSADGIPWGLVKRDVNDISNPNYPLYFEQVSDTVPRALGGPDHYGHTFGSPLAKQISQGYSNWILLGQSRLFYPNGVGWYSYGPDEQVCAVSFIVDITHCPPEQLLSAPHAAIRTKALLAMLTPAIDARDEQTVTYVENAYLTLRQSPTSLAFLGFFVEYVAGQGWHNRVETDEVADMIEIARRLAKYRHSAQYWGDVDSYVRNQFAEMQLTPDKIAMLKDLRTQTRNANYPFVHQEFFSLVDNQWVMASSGPHAAQVRVKAGDGVFDDLLGAFGSYSLVNKWGYFTQDASGNIQGSFYDVMMCCLLNAAKALYGVWDGMYENLGNGVIQVNLMLNRSGPELDVYSWLPFYGRVDVRSHLPTQQLTVRMLLPSWFGDNDCGQILVKITANPVSARGHVCSVDRYFQFALLPNEQLSIYFPVRDYNRNSVINTPNGPVNYGFKVRGTQVVQVTPNGTERLSVNGQTKELGVPFYTQYQTSIQPGTNNWIPPLSEGEMLTQMYRYIPVPEPNPY